MNLTKTRIWGSPLVPSPPPEDDDGSQSGGEQRSAREPTLDLSSTRVAPVEQQHAAGELAQRISPRSGTRIMNLATLLPRMLAREQPASSDHAEASLVRGATRILPIEQLTRALQSEQPERPSAAGGERESWPTEAPPQRAPKNVLRLVCVALAALCIVLWVAAALVTPGAAPSAPAQGSAVSRPAALPVARSASSHEESVRASAPERVSGARAQDDVVDMPRPSAPTNDTRPRAAVDALVRGDEELARSLYEELASARPEQTVFAEAARILRMRQTGEQ